MLNNLSVPVGEVPDRAIVDEVKDDDLDTGVTIIEPGEQLEQVDTVVLRELPPRFRNPFASHFTKSDLEAAEMRDVYSRNPTVYFLCLNGGDKNHVASILESGRDITREEYESLYEHLTLEAVSNNALKNADHKRYAKFVSKVFLEGFNGDNYPLKGTSIVIPAYNINVDLVQNYSSLFDGYVDFQVIQDLLSVYHFYNGASYSPSRDKLVQLIMQRRGSEYWTNKYNCMLSKSTAFADRKFTRPSYNTSNKNVQAITDLLSKLSQDGGDVDYLPTGNDVGGYDLKPDKKRYFFSGQKKGNSASVNEWIISVPDLRVKFILYASFLLNKDQSHLVMNKELLEHMTPVFRKCMPLLRYVFARGWLPLVLDENLNRWKTSPEDRYVFDIETASKLPVFPYNVRDVNDNPYTPFPVAANLIQNSKNYLGVPMVTDKGKFSQLYGISTLADFKRKFNLFTTGRADVNIFDGLEWGDKFAITGSAMVPCIQKDSPLTYIMMSDNDNDRFTQYVNNLYSGADIDLMCVHDTQDEFLCAVAHVIEVVTKNLELIHGKDMNADVTVEAHKKLIITVNRKYIENEPMNVETFDQVVNDPAKAYIRKVLYHNYTHAKMHEIRANMNKKKNGDISPQLKMLLDLTETYVPMEEFDLNVIDADIDSYLTPEQQARSEALLVIRLSELTGKPPKEGESDPIVAKIIDGIKFKVKATGYMNHDIEVFRIKNSFWNTVSRFHLPCVRSYYNGTNVFSLASAIGALMTNVNTDYKYFAGARNPQDIMEKYRSRGIGTILNETERKQIVKHNANQHGDPELSSLSKMHNIKLNSDDSITRHLSPQDLNSEIYKMSAYLNGTPTDIYQKVHFDYVMNHADMVRMYENLYNYNSHASIVKYLDLPLIGADGNVVPLMPEIVTLGAREFFP